MRTESREDEIPAVRLVNFRDDFESLFRFAQLTQPCDHDSPHSRHLMEAMVGR
jgi:hypothetical protein